MKKEIKFTEPRFKIGDIVIIPIRKIIEEDINPIDTNGQEEPDCYFEEFCQCSVIGATFINNATYNRKTKKEVKFNHWTYLLSFKLFCSDPYEISVDEEYIIQAVI